MVVIPESQAIQKYAPPNLPITNPSQHNSVTTSSEDQVYKTRIQQLDQLSVLAY
jgi:hypothetical protein